MIKTGLRIIEQLKQEIEGLRESFIKQYPFDAIDKSETDWQTYMNASNEVELEINEIKSFINYLEGKGEDYKFVVTSQVVGKKYCIEIGFSDPDKRKRRFNERFANFAENFQSEKQVTNDKY